MKRGRGRGWEEVGGGWLLPLPLLLFLLPLLLLLLLLPPLPVATPAWLCVHTPCVYSRCQLSFNSRSPTHPLSFTHSRSLFTHSHPPLLFLFTRPPSFVHHCPHPLVASLVTSLLHPPAFPIFPWSRTPVHQPFVAALACLSMCVDTFAVG